MATPSAQSQADVDLDLKLRLENEFRRGLRSTDGQLVRDVVRSVGVTGGLPDVESLTRERVEPLLEDHYQRVVAAFSDEIRAELPDDVGATSTEDAVIATSLATALGSRAEAQARLIGETNLKDAERALSFERIRGFAEGLSIQEIAFGTGALFSRSLRGREGARACFETQASAELSKQVEADVLSKGAPPTKEWITVGDDKVRPHHVAVDSVKVPLDRAFTVNQERLMYPGDTSLGATASNVVNCRCASVVDRDAITSGRRV